MQILCRSDVPCGPNAALCNVTSVHNETTGRAHVHTHRHVRSLFWPTGPFQPNQPFLFLVVSAKTWWWSCSVSVCRRLWVPCMFLLLPIVLSFSSLSLRQSPPPSLPSSGFGSFVSFDFHLLPVVSLSLPLPSFLPLCLSLLFSPSSVLNEVQYRMRVHCCPSLSLSRQRWLAAAHRSACRLLNAGGSGILHYVTVSACCCRALNHAESEHLLPAHGGRVGTGSSA